MLNEKDLFKDPDTTGFAIEAKNTALLLDSCGDVIYGRLLSPALKDEAELSPVIVMLHGYPGTEQNMDVPQPLRRAGIACATFSYRGVWGSHGHYCFSHMIEDAQTVINHVVLNSEKLHIDPARIYIFGHSMGGFTAMNLLARDCRIRGAVIAAPCDVARRFQEKPEAFDHMMQLQKKGYFNVPDEHYMAEDVRLHADEWKFSHLARIIPPEKPVRFIGGLRDMQTPPQEHIIPALEIMKKRGCNYDYTEIDDSHAFPANRVKLTRLIFDLINEMEH